MWQCRSSLLLQLHVLESHLQIMHNSTCQTCIHTSEAWKPSSLTIPCIQIIIWPFTFPSTFYCMALSIPGGHSLLSGSLAYSSASLQIIKLVGSIIWSWILGEYEKTTSSSFVQFAALKTLILKAGTPEVIRHCNPIFKKFIDPQIWDTLLMDIMSFLATETLDTTDDDPPPVQLKLISHLPDSLKDCFWKCFGSLSTSTSTLSQLTISGITYSVASRHTGNSCVFLGSPSMDVFLPAQIEYIVQFVSKNDNSSVTTLVAVWQFKQHDTWSDPFSSYSLLQA